jgi:hypothetical protein
MPKKELEINDADVPVIPIGRIVEPAKLKAGEQAIPAYAVFEDGKLDDLDREVLGALLKAAESQGRPIDLAKFHFGSKKEMVGYPGGQYLNWVISIKNIWTSKHLRTDPFLWPRGNYFVILNEIEALGELG